MPVIEDIRYIIVVVYIAKCPNVNLIDTVYIGDYYNLTSILTNLLKP